MITLLIRLILLRVQQTQARGRTNVDTFVTFKFQVTNKVQNRVSKSCLTPGPLNQLNCTLPEISSIPGVNNSSPDARLHGCSEAWGNSFEKVLRPIPVDKLPRKEQLSVHDYRKRGTQERLGSVMDGAVKAMKSDVVFEATYLIWHGLFVKIHWVTFQNSTPPVWKSSNFLIRTRWWQCRRTPKETGREKLKPGIPLAAPPFRVQPCKTPGATGTLGLIGS